MKKTTIAEIAFGAGLLGAIGTGAYAAQAHDGTFDATCTGYSLHLTNYPNHSSVTGTIDGAPVEAIFNGKYDLSSAWTGDKHSISLSAVSGDGDKRYNKTFTKEIAGCLPTSTPSSPAPSGTPSTPANSIPTSTPSAPTPSESPATGPTTTSPTPSSPTSSESASPSTEPTPHPTPTDSTVTVPNTKAPTFTTPSGPNTAPKTEAPVPVAVQAPATFTG